MDISIAPTPTPTPTPIPPPPTTTTTNIIPNTDTNNNNTTSAKSTEPDRETPTWIQPARPLSFSNGVLRRHYSHHHHHVPVVITYRECLKNHAASLGRHALDGCGEFMPSPTATHTDPTSLKCAACGCHRNFHRREPEGHHSPPPPPPATTAAIEYQPHHRHHPPPPPPPQQQHQHPTRSPNSASPPPISSSYYPSAPHMLLALSGGGLSGLNDGGNLNATTGSSPRKRFRTKFTQSQKDRMFQFAERVGWKMQRKDEELVQEFCSEIRVDKGVLKVWMHNNKNTFGKRDGDGNVISNSNNINAATTTTTSLDQNIHTNNNNSSNNSSEDVDHHHNHLHYENVQHDGSNGSSSSS